MSKDTHTLYTQASERGIQNKAEGLYPGPAAGCHAPKAGARVDPSAGNQKPHTAASGILHAAMVGIPSTAT